MKKRVFTFLLIFCLLSGLCNVHAATAQDISTLLSSDLMILVNRTHKVSEKYQPKNLVSFQNSGYKLNKECAAALGKMINGCKAAGLKSLTLYSGYRSYQSQYNKYYGKIDRYMAQGYSRAEAVKLTDRYYAPPGGSEHHTGLAADICTQAIVEKYGALHESFGTTAEGKWLRNNAHKYGFILRYDQGKEKITGYNYEPWHFRYVGVTTATEIHQSGLTLEEYIQKLQTIAQKIKYAPKAVISNQSIRFVADSTVYYTTDLKIPTNKSAKYEKPLSKKDVTYTAVAYNSGYYSPVSTVTITKYGDIFTDISKKDWYYSFVSDAVHQGLFNGTAANVFSPENNMTRAMLVQVFANLEGINLSLYSGKSAFSDVKTSAWYSKAVNWAAKNNVVSGYEDGTFRPNRPITREEVCKIITNYAKHKGIAVTASDCSFRDKKDISKWAYKDVCFCAEQKIVSGKSNRIFDPKNTATRAEVAKMTLQLSKIL